MLTLGGLIMAMTKEEAEKISWKIRQIADEVDAMVQDTEESKKENASPNPTTAEPKGDTAPGEKSGSSSPKKKCSVTGCDNEHFHEKGDDLEFGGSYEMKSTLCKKHVDEFHKVKN